MGCHACPRDRRVFFSTPCELESSTRFARASGDCNCDQAPPLAYGCAAHRLPRGIGLYTSQLELNGVASRAILRS